VADTFAAEPLLHVPGAIADYVHNRSDRRGHEALSRGIVAVAARDREAAKRHSDRAVRLLPNDPLARLLEAQTAQLRGDNQRVERIFADMLGRPETEIVALRGLYIRARQAGNEARARGFAERAYRRQPSLDWASDAVVKTQAAQRDWPAVLAVLESQRRSKLLDEDVYKRKRAVVLTAQAQEAEASDPDAALDLAGKALKLEPGLVPAAVLAARIHFARGYLKRGLKVVEKAWAINHHPDLADAYAPCAPRRVDPRPARPHPPPDRGGAGRGGRRGGAGARGHRGAGLEAGARGHRGLRLGPAAGAHHACSWRRSRKASSATRGAPGNGCRGPWRRRAIRPGWPTATCPSAGCRCRR
jgi:tetratricopeptide (TPR) repeat protein